MVTFALIEARARGWGSPVIIGGFAAAAALTAAFVAAERRARNPMIPLVLFRDRAFGGGTAIGLLINLGFYGQLFVTSLYLQNTRHMSPVAAGLALLPEGILVSARVLPVRAAHEPYGRTADDAHGPLRRRGRALRADGRRRAHALPRAGPAAMAAGFGMAFTMPAATTTVVEAAPAERAGVASGAINAGRQVGSTIGVALLGTLSGSAGLPAAMAGAGTAFLLAAAVVVVAVPRTDRTAGPRIR